MCNCSTSVLLQVKWLYNFLFYQPTRGYILMLVFNVAHLTEQGASPLDFTREFVWKGVQVYKAQNGPVGVVLDRETGLRLTDNTVHIESNMLMTFCGETVENNRETYVIKPTQGERTHSLAMVSVEGTHRGTAGRVEIGVRGGVKLLTVKNDDHGMPCAIVLAGKKRGSLHWTRYPTNGVPVCYHWECVKGEWMRITEGVQV